MARPQADSTSRLQSIDALRGLIMAVMAVDHARAFIARDHPFEIWAAPMPVYDAVLPFFTRLITHFCAPGFFFLMGVSMSLLAITRGRAGWSAARITRYFVKRGVLLFAVEQLIENPAWMIGMMGGAHASSSDTTLTAVVSSGPALVFGVLYALSASMIVWAALVRAPALLIACISGAAIVFTQVLTPDASQAAFAFSPVERLLMVPGTTGLLFVLYPLVPWMGLTGLGIVFGRSLAAPNARTARYAFAWGATALIIFVGVRLANGFGNIHTPIQSGVMGFLNVTKYPPSLAFVMLTLGVDLLLFGALSTWWKEPAWGKPLVVFGRTALFFYVAHLYLFAVIGLAFPHGAPLPLVYPIWLAGLCLLYLMCVRYLRFKSAKPIDSLWRFF